MPEDRVTLRDVYEVMNRIEAKFEKRLDSVEEDIEKIKSFQNKALGIMSVITIFASGASSFIWNKVTGK